MFSNDLPITQCALEEIALEGLEGITVEGLWKRLSVRLKFSLPLPPKLTETLWSYVKKSDCLSFFVLPVDREPLKIFDRVECVDPETGSPIDPVNIHRIEVKSNRFRIISSCHCRKHARTTIINSIQSQQAPFVDLVNISILEKRFRTTKCN